MSLNTHPSQWVNMARVDKLLEDVLDISLDDEEMFWEKEFRYEEYDNSIGDTKLNSQRIDDHDYLMDPQDVCSRKFGSYVAMYNLSSSAKTVEDFLLKKCLVLIWFKKSLKTCSMSAMNQIPNTA